MEDKIEKSEDLVDINTSNSPAVDEASPQQPKEILKNRKKFSKPRRRLSAKLTRKSNWFITNNINEVDYKNTKVLKNFINRRGEIVSIVFSRLPRKIHNQVSNAIKRARQMKLMPYTIIDQEA